MNENRNFSDWGEVENFPKSGGLQKNQPCLGVPVKMAKKGKKTKIFQQFLTGLAEVQVGGCKKYAGLEVGVLPLPPHTPTVVEQF